MKGLSALGGALKAGKRVGVSAVALILKLAGAVPKSVSLQALLLGLNSWLFYAGAALRVHVCSCSCSQALRRLECKFF